MKRNIAFAAVLTLLALWIGLPVMQAHVPASLRHPSVAETLLRADRDDGRHGHDQSPNIVFIILDDVGVDQLESYGLGKGVLPRTPNLDAIVNAGVRFTNVWAMPECSPSRSTMFTGRYPLRTGVTSAIIPNMIPQAHVSPYETTLPRVLATAGYTSAMMGKYHLGNQNPSGNCAPQTRGWDRFDGNMEAGPPSIDEQGGHVEDGAGDPKLVCGYEQGVGLGSCYFEDRSCRDDVVDVPTADGATREAVVNGRHCLEAGGLFVPGEVCKPTDLVACPDDATRFDCLEVGVDKVGHAATVARSESRRPSSSRRTLGVSLARPK